MVYYIKRTGAGKKLYIYIFIIAHVNHELFILKHKINPKLVFLFGKFYKIACQQESHATIEKEDTGTVAK